MLITSHSPPPTSSQLDAAESVLGLSFPAAYRRFLESHNGGLPRPSGFVGQDAEQTEIAIEEFFGIDVDDEEKDVVKVTTGLEGSGFPDTWLVIGSCGEDFLLLGTADGECGKVYYWPFIEEGFDNGRIVEIAPSFDELLRGLQYFESEQPWRELIDRADVESLRAWLDGGGNANAVDSRRGHRPVEYAAWTGQLEIVRLLRERGAKKKNAFRYAIDAHQHEVAKLLLKEGVGPDEIEHAALSPGIFDDNELVELLRKRGAKL